MTIDFTNQKGNKDFIEVNRSELIEIYNKKGLRGICWGIRAKKRRNDANPITIGFFESEEKRNIVLKEIQTAIEAKQTKYVVKNTIPVDRDFSKIMQ